MALKPAPTKASSSRKDIASSVVQPNTLPPNMSGAIAICDFPSLRFSIASFPVSWEPGGGCPIARAVAKPGRHASIACGAYFFLAPAPLVSADQLPPTSGAGAAKSSPATLDAGALEERDPSPLGAGR